MFFIAAFAAQILHQLNAILNKMHIVGFFAFQQRFVSEQAIILIGSLARGDERVDSDVDLYLITTDEAFAARPYSERLGFGDIKHSCDCTSQRL